MDLSKAKFDTKKVNVKKDLKAITGKIYGRGKPKAKVKGMDVKPKPKLVPRSGAGSKNPSGAKFLAPGSKALPASYFRNMKK